MGDVDHQSVMKQSILQVISVNSQVYGINSSLTAEVNWWKYTTYRQIILGKVVGIQQTFSPFCIDAAGLYWHVKQVQPQAAS